MATLIVEVRDELLPYLVREDAEGNPPDSSEAARALLMWAAAHLVSVGRLSQGRAAEMVGMGRCEFLCEVGAYGGVIYCYTPEELEQEIENATRAVRRRSSESGEYPE